MRAAQLQVVRDALLTLGCAAPRQVMACSGLIQGLPMLLELLVDGKPCPTFLGSDAADELGFLLL
ncbi:hypothetical protein MF271_24505 (plasmid) [Deinococcus sp. KNUC1210]|uniref:hypothetical protein n=1 Tax=Deinococcus sp. KNUC1210 TaxID=2917691 RepID=UPI001EF14DE1|nr:hypothetical protein [Deinococcus sp. KNUC1210]ULH18118.1 hypothetical protein MF271_24505 [Deinococcus sp. KNUC1210]